MQSAQILKFMKYQIKNKNTAILYCLIGVKKELTYFDKLLQPSDILHYIRSNSVLRSDRLCILHKYLQEKQRYQHRYGEQYDRENLGRKAATNIKIIC